MFDQILTFEPRPWPHFSNFSQFFTIFLEFFEYFSQLKKEKTCQILEIGNGIFFLRYLVFKLLVDRKGKKKKNMICKHEILTKNSDVFRAMAAKWKKKNLSEVTDTDRQQVKQICYGILYGIGNKSLRLFIFVCPSQNE